MVEPNELMEVKHNNLSVRNVNGTALYEIYFPTGGKLPTALSGKYTSIHMAKNAIALHKLEQEKPKRAYRKRK